ncbi:MAG: hypothetical protein V4858_26835 [Pseudomonadota bacterium]
MKLTQHLGLLAQATAVWAAFWLLGLPAYYQQYSAEGLAMASVLLSVLISLAALFVLARTRPEVRMSRAFWLSFYYTVPFAILDTLYCGIYLGHGGVYLLQYWYLTVFYFSPWLTFMPTAMLLRKVK